MPGDATLSQCDLVPLPGARLCAAHGRRHGGLRLGRPHLLGLRAVKSGAKRVPEHHQGAK